MPAGQVGGGRFADEDETAGARAQASPTELVPVAARKPRFTKKVVAECHVAYGQDIAECQKELEIVPGTFNPGDQRMAVCAANAAQRLADCLKIGKPGMSNVPLFSGVTD